MKTEFCAGKIFVTLIACALGAGCASQRQAHALSIRRGELPVVTNKVAGTVVMHPFVDARNPDEKPFIGEMRNPAYISAGQMIVLQDDSLTNRLTQSFAEALGQAGYTASVRPQMAEERDVALDGSIKKFWLTPAWNTRQEIVIELRLSADGNVVWQKTIDVAHGKFIGLWNRPEFEEVIQKAVDKALAQTISEVTGPEFRQHFTERK